MIRGLTRFWPNKWFILGLALATGAWSLLAQMTPDSPIQHFRLPMFGDNGYKKWELRGLKGHYHSEAEALVEGLELVVFSGDESMDVENRIRSPKALIHLQESKAEGESSLFVVGPGYEIQGRNWIWEGLERKIVVRESVRVSFAGTVDILD